MRIKAELKGALLALLGVALAVAGLWVATGIRLGIWTPEQYGRYLWLTENLGIAHELWNRHIMAGEDVEQLIRLWHPHRTARFGRWVELSWYPGGDQSDGISFIGLTVIAKDGVLANATSWSDDGVDDRVFFDTLNAKEKVEYRSAFETYVAQLVAQKAERKASITITNELDRSISR